MKIAVVWSFSTNRRPIGCAPLPGGSVRPALFRAVTVGGIALLHILLVLLQCFILRDIKAVREKTQSGAAKR